MAEQFESKYFRGQGKVFLAPRDAAGNPAGLVFVGDLTSADLSPQIEKEEIIENTTGTNGLGASVTTSRKYSLSMVMRSVKKEHLAIALQADLTTKASGSVTDESHTAYADKMIALVHHKVSTVVVTNSAGTTTYTVNTDYIVHADEGMIEILSTGNIADGSTVLIDYSYTAQGHLAANPSSQYQYLVFAGVNSADNDKQVRCEIYKLKLDPSVLSMITSNITDMTLTGEVVLDTLRAAGDQFYSWKLES